MKKIIISLATLFIVSSCVMDKRTCWICTTKTAFTFLDEDKSDPYISTYITEKCNKTRSEIIEYERTLTSIHVVRDDYMTIITTTDCILKNK